MSYKISFVKLKSEQKVLLPQPRAHLTVKEASQRPSREPVGCRLAAARRPQTLSHVGSVAPFGGSARLPPPPCSPWGDAPVPPFSGHQRRGLSYLWPEPGTLCPVSRTFGATLPLPGGGGEAPAAACPGSSFPGLGVCICGAGLGKEGRLGSQWTPGQTPAPPLTGCV